MKTLNHIAILLLSFLAMGAAHADVSGEARSLTVQFADLDLTRPEGAVTLFGRIREAAKNVCAPLQGTTARQKQVYTSCVDFALTNAVARVDRPVLSEYFTHRSLKTAPVKVVSAR